ncbi:MULTISPECIES: hypothetical protein [Streptomyces]|uniref:hypothetical protein n=1 Tax=Streptomyces TaxID=1883 RepID=UPI0007CD452D|nr:hypothetical protein A4V12_29480 [Streptomyces noursei]
MEMHFRKLPAQPTGPTMPHDLVHAVVETALGIDDGFWGSMARGATFQGFALVEPGRHRRSGLKVLRRGGDAVMAAELSVNWAYRVWRGLPTEGRGVGRPPLTGDEPARTTGPLDAAAARWSTGPLSPRVAHCRGAGARTADGTPGRTPGAGAGAGQREPGWPGTRCDP